MGRTVEKISEGESFEIDYLSRNYQSGQPVIAFKVSGDVTGAGQVQMAAAPSIGGVIQTLSTGYQLTIFTAGSGVGTPTVTAAKVGDIVLGVIDLTAHTDVSADFAKTITVAGQISQTTGTGANPTLILLSHQS